jgi:hypothetical protein
MNIWNTLEIEQTTDLRAIKRAYSKKLKQIDVDKDPDDFYQLREAFELAKESIQSPSSNSMEISEDLSNEDSKTKPIAKHSIIDFSSAEQLAQKVINCLDAQDQINAQKFYIENQNNIELTEPIKHRHYEKQILNYLSESKKPYMGTFAEYFYLNSPILNESANYEEIEWEHLMLHWNLENFTKYSKFIEILESNSKDDKDIDFNDLLFGDYRPAQFRSTHKKEKVVSILRDVFTEAESDELNPFEIDELQNENVLWWRKEIGRTPFNTSYLWFGLWGRLFIPYIMHGFFSIRKDLFAYLFDPFTELIILATLGVLSIWFKDFVYNSYRYKIRGEDDVRIYDYFQTTKAKVGLAIFCLIGITFVLTTSLDRVVMWFSVLTIIAYSMLVSKELVGIAVLTTIVTAIGTLKHLMANSGLPGSPFGEIMFLYIASAIGFLLLTYITSAVSMLSKKTENFVGSTLWVISVLTANASLIIILAGYIKA